MKVKRRKLARFRKVLMKLRARQRGNEALIPKYYKVMRVALPILFLIVTPGLAFAWEFSIESSLLNFRYIYASQAGSNGFFGPFNVDMSSKGGDLGSAERVVPNENANRHNRHVVINSYGQCSRS